jgi:transcriptional regulator GlxA family with amidase domain
MFGAALTRLPERIGFLLIPNFSMMAFTSSIEPLRAANRLAGEQLYEWRTFSMDGQPVTASNDLEVGVGAPIDEVRDITTLFVCAGLGAARFRNPHIAGKLRELSRRGIALGGVCTGSLALARAGLLEGYRCTIHWENVEGFAEEYPELEITATMFEIDRNRYTSSGGTAPLDMMINSIAVDHGDDLAVRVAEFLVHHSVRHPHDMQRMPLQHRTGITHPKLLAAIAHMEAYVESPVPVHDLAASVNLSSRQFERLFRERLGKPPSRYYLELRLQRARLLLRQTSMSVLQIAVATGFASASHFTRSYRHYFDRTPSTERRQLERVPRS